MRHTHFLMPLALVSAMAAVQQAYAADDFVVRDIRVNGLVRLTPLQMFIPCCQSTVAIALMNR